MKKFKVIFSIFMVVVIASMSVLPTFALDNSYSMDKLDDELVSKLDEIGNDEKVTVSIWFDDVDEEQVKDKLYEKCKRNKDINYSKSEELLFGEVCDMPVGYTGDYLSYAKEYYKDVTQEEFQYVSDKKREVFRNEYRNHNKNMMDDITEVLGNRNVEDCYVSKYAPNIELDLTKDEILELSEMQNVEELYLVEANLELLSEESVVLSEDDDDDFDYSYDDIFFDVTGLSTGRDAFGLNGYGMKVGVIEKNAILSTSQLNNDNVTIFQQGNNISLRGNLISGLMVSNRSDFTGAIPYAELCYTTVECEDSTDDVIEDAIKVAVETLLDADVTAINCSFSYPSQGNVYYNSYGDIAKWYDHIAVQHNVHLILSSGSNGGLGVKPSNTVFNAIVVGNCNNSGEISEDSSYSSGETLKYKPDIVAPGTNIRTPIYGASGTSYSAPLVTSAVIQLSQASPILAANPSLMKSLLLSSSTITSSMQNEPMYSIVGSDSIALSRQYGAGRLNLTKAYETFVTKGNYITSSFSNYSTGAIFNRNITKVANKTLRFCLTWDKYNAVEDEHDTGTVNSASLDNLSLTVVTPSGVTYTSNYLYDNKQMITFNATENGYYSIRVYRQGTSNSNHAVDYSITYSAR